MTVGIVTAKMDFAIVAVGLSVKDVTNLFNPCIAALKYGIKLSSVYPREPRRLKSTVTSLPATPASNLAS